MISSLPPVIGLSPYTKGLITELAKIIKVKALVFRHIYPKFLYPGKLIDESAELLEEGSNLSIRPVLDWFNPLGWILEAFRIDTPVIHAQWWSYPLAPVYFVLLGINRLRKKKIVLTIHNVEPHEKSLLKNFLNKSIFELADEYIVHTEHNRQQLQKYVPNRSIHVIPHGILHYPQTDMTRQDARHQLGIGAGEQVVLCFGHIREYKGLDVALKALALIPDKNVKLLIAGKCWENWEKYAVLIRELGLKNRVYLHINYIPTDKTEIFFKAADLLLLPYKHFDSQSGVGALVLSFGIPCLVSDTGGLTDYVHDPHCIIAPGNAEQLAEKMTWLLENAHFCDKLKQNLLKKKKVFSWDGISERTLRVYSRWIGRKGEQGDVRKIN